MAESPDEFIASLLEKLAEPICAPCALPPVDGPFVGPAGVPPESYTYEDDEIPSLALAPFGIDLAELQRTGIAQQALVSLQFQGPQEQPHQQLLQQQQQQQQHPGELQQFNATVFPAASVQQSAGLATTGNAALPQIVASSNQSDIQQQIVASCLPGMAAEDDPLCVFKDAAPSQAYAVLPPTNSPGFESRTLSASDSGSGSTVPSRSNSADSIISSAPSYTSFRDLRLPAPRTEEQTLALGFKVSPEGLARASPPQQLLQQQQQSPSVRAGNVRYMNDGLVRIINELPNANYTAANPALTTSLQKRTELGRAHVYPEIQAPIPLQAWRAQLPMASFGGFGPAAQFTGVGQSISHASYHAPLPPQFPNIPLNPAGLWNANALAAPPAESQDGAGRNDCRPATGRKVSTAAPAVPSHGGRACPAPEPNKASFRVPAPANNKPIPTGPKDERGTMPPDEDLEHEDPAKRAVPNTRTLAHCVDDLLSPRYVRGFGMGRDGFCDMCPPGVATYYNIKRSTYAYHRQYMHGISAKTGRPFKLPLNVSWDGNKTVAYCDVCEQTVLYQSTGDLDPAGQYKGRPSSWYRHAKKCHEKEAKPAEKSNSPEGDELEADDEDEVEHQRRPTPQQAQARKRSYDALDEAQEPSMPTKGKRNKIQAPQA